MNRYIYPQNLKATANLWLWSIKDFVITCVAALASAVLLTQLHVLLPLALTIGFAFLTIRLDETTIIDFIRYSVKFFISTQQYYEWR